ncbi:hypothetical protein JXJ21_16995 [candidate division KSB1 bacterium]|nr:hypothetical protein [candidate division KSB1 bacterium]
MDDLTRFHACMNYEAVDRCPNHEIGVWPQTKKRWQTENKKSVGAFHWDWLEYESSLELDRREYIAVNYGFIPPYPEKVLSKTDEYEIVQSPKGIVSKVLLEGKEGGLGMSMDQYLKFPVAEPEDFAAIKKRLVSAIPERYPADLEQKLIQWQDRECPLILGRCCAVNGFYWRAREFMGTEALSLAWYDMPHLMHEMMEVFADFVIETSRPVLEKIQIDYFTFNEDMSMKSGPLLSPDTYKKFIFPHAKRVIEFLRSYGTQFIAVDTDGNPTALIPLLLDAGVDTLWPLERAADAHPLELRKKFGKSLRLWGGVDKRVLNQGEQAIKAHLKELIPLIEEGGFIPTIDHTVPPDISWDTFRMYMDYKQSLIRGEFEKLE